MNFIPDGFILCMTTAEACVLMSPCSVISHTSTELEAALGSCLHDTMFSNETEVCPFNPTGHLPHHDSSSYCGLSHLERKLSHRATWQCQSLNSVQACFPVSSVVAVYAQLTGFNPNGSSMGFQVCLSLFYTHLSKSKLLKRNMYLEERRKGGLVLNRSGILPEIWTVFPSFPPRVIMQ